MNVPSKYPHPTYKVTTQLMSDYDGLWEREDRVRCGTTDDLHPDAELVSSRIDGTDEHTIMLDLDVSAALVSSSTEGHSHLYVDVALPWRKYKRLLRALAKAGVIEEGYYRASVQRKHTALRLPGVKKQGRRP